MTQIPLELIIAESENAAYAYADKAGWRFAQRPRLGWQRTEEDGRALADVHYVTWPDMIKSTTPETVVHIGPFRGGIPAEWLKAIHGRKIANAAELLESGFGEFKAMHSAPANLPFLAWPRRGSKWVIAERLANYSFGWLCSEGHAHRIEDFLCWRDAPPAPPEFLIRAALESSNGERVQDRDDRAGAYSGDRGA